MRSVKNVQLHPGGGGRHCRARVGHVMAALGRGSGGLLS
jgi:hypothetical protein